MLFEFSIEALGPQLAVDAERIGPLSISSNHPEGPKVMSDIVIRCPIFHTPVPTGLRTDTIKFASLPNISFRLRCTSMQEVAPLETEGCVGTQRLPRLKIRRRATPRKYYLANSLLASSLRQSASDHRLWYLPFAIKLVGFGELAFIHFSASAACILA
jgi:hypothetical protein